MLSASYSSLLLAVLSGLSAALGAAFVKCAFSSDDSFLEPRRLISIFLFVLFNVVMWLSLTAAFRSSPTTGFVSSINTATNIFFSGLIGWFFFGEILSLTWLIGIVLISIGVSGLMSKTKREIEEKYRPIFARYANEAIPLDRIRQEFELDELLTASAENGGSLLVDKQLSPQVRSRLRDMADLNGDGYLSYTEFVRMVEELPFSRKLLRFAVTGIVPGRPKSTKRRIVRNEYLKVTDDTPTIDSYIEQYTCCPPPFFIILITLAEIGVYLYYYFDMLARNVPVSLKTGTALYSPLIWDPHRRYEAWRYISYIFLHSGLYHLISNVLSQLILGIPLEMVHGFWRVGLVYLLGAGLGALAHSLTDFEIWMCGASGGVYALIGAQLANTILNWDQMNYKWLSGSCLRFVLSAPMRILFWVIYCGADLGYTIYRKVTLGPSFNVAISAHIGGLICGLLIGLPVLRNLSIKTWERVVEVLSMVIFILLVGGSIAFNLLYQDMPTLNWDPLGQYSEALINKTRA